MTKRSRFDEIVRNTLNGELNDLDMIDPSFGKSVLQALISRYISNKNIVSIVRNVIYSSSTNINHRDKFGNYVLHDVIYDLPSSKHKSVLSAIFLLLLDHPDIEVNIVFSNKNILYRLLEFNNPYLLHYFIQHPKLDFNVVIDNGNNALMKGIINKLPLSQTIINLTTDINHQNNEGNTALHLAILHYPDIVPPILAHPNVMTDIVNRDGQMAKDMGIPVYDCPKKREAYINQLLEEGNTRPFDEETNQIFFVLETRDHITSNMYQTLYTQKSTYKSFLNADLNIYIRNERGVDAGGITRELYYEFGNQMKKILEPEYPIEELFTTNTKNIKFANIYSKKREMVIEELPTYIAKLMSILPISNITNYNFGITLQDIIAYTTLDVPHDVYYYVGIGIFGMSHTDISEILKNPTKRKIFLWIYAKYFDEQDERHLMTFMRSYKERKAIEYFEPDEDGEYIIIEQIKEYIEFRKLHKINWTVLINLLKPYMGGLHIFSLYRALNRNPHITPDEIEYFINNQLHFKNIPPKMKTHILELLRGDYSKIVSSLLVEMREVYKNHSDFLKSLFQYWWASSRILMEEQYYINGVDKMNTYIRTHTCSFELEINRIIKTKNELLRHIFNTINDKMTMTIRGGRRMTRKRRQRKHRTRKHR
jgi:hypothetical protein